MLDHQDHRAVGPRLGLFHLQEEAPGMVFWHPPGLVLVQALEAAVRRRTRAEGYREVRTPQLLRRSIWEASGHWQHFRQHMFTVDEGGLEAALKPVSCPCHIQIFGAHGPLVPRPAAAAVRARRVPPRRARRHAARPVSPAAVHAGRRPHLLRRRAQSPAEIEGFCRGALAFYAALGFPDVHVALSTRPPERAGDDATWDRAEAELAAAAAAAGLRPTLQPGEGAFYGPKLELSVHDHVGRRWQCGTIQLDLVLPERFDIHYVDAAGQRRRPVMLHRALYGSLERFVALLLERGPLPAWLAPVQVVLAPVGPQQRPAAAALLADLRSAGLRAELDERDESLARRVAEAHSGGIPCFAVLGAREVASDTVTLREGAGAQRVLGREQAITHLLQRCVAPV
jgi:threonyl-tRNA synthetase